MQGLSTSVANAIYHRRSVRAYTGALITGDALQDLLQAAVQAPTAQHEEAWAFVIVQEPALLARISATVKQLLLDQLPEDLRESDDPHTVALRSPGFDVFHGAGNLILICGPREGHFVAADCWLAAENLMLLAHAMGLGSCVIGSALPALNGEFRGVLGLPDDMTAYVPIAVGVPRETPPPSPRRLPRILARFPAA